MVIVVSLLVWIVGLVVYLIVSNAKVAELGRLAFAVGLLIFMLLGMGDNTIEMFK